MSARPDPAPSPNMARVMCPHLKCRKVLSVPAENRGQIVKCQHCQNLLRVPDAIATPKAADAA